MSSTLKYRITPKGKSLPDELKYVLRDTPTHYDSQYEWREDDLPYLQGLADAQVKGAEKLMELINKYGAVETYLE